MDNNSQTSFEQLRDKWLESKEAKDLELKNLYGIEGNHTNLHKLRASELTYLKKMEEHTGNIKNGVGLSNVVESSSGFGLGFKQSMAASRGDHFKRFLTYSNPTSASSKEIFKNSIGIMNEGQRIRAKQANSFFGKLGASIVPLGVLGAIAYSANQNEDVLDIAQTVMPFAAAQYGWRAGKALGGSVTKANTLGRFVGMTAGGLGLGYIGLQTASGLLSAGKDLTGNDSGIAAWARGLQAKSVTFNGVDTNASMTNRQKALQKLAKSGLNDRAQLLGNEALVLAGMY